MQVIIHQSKIIFYRIMLCLFLSVSMSAMVLADRCIGDCENGLGTYQWKSGDKYTGHWKNGKQHGDGQLQLADGSQYDGDWMQGVKTGEGKLVFGRRSKLAGESYDGQWLNDEYHGTGTYVWANKNLYVGDWKNNAMHGQGTKSWVDGREYTGSWKQDKLHGYGVYRLSDGTTYRGDWVGNKKQGLGEFIFGKNSQWFGDRYKGHWNQDKKQGKGQYFWANGSWFVGRWKNDKRVGMGKYTNESGVESYGEWQGERFIAIKKKSKQLSSIALINQSIHQANQSKGISHALVVGNNNYEQLGKLPTIMRDINRIGFILEKDYNFILKKKFNIKKSAFFDAINDYKKQLTEQDNLMIYYSGYAYKSEGDCFWLLKKANSLSDTHNGISTKRLLNQLMKFPVNKVLLITSHCFASKKQENHSVNSLEVISTNQNKPMIKNKKSLYSLFAGELINQLQRNTHQLTAFQLSHYLKSVLPLRINTHYIGFIKPGHQGIGFLKTVE